MNGNLFILLAYWLSIQIQLFVATSVPSFRPTRVPSRYPTITSKVPSRTPTGRPRSPKPTLIPSKSPKTKSPIRPSVSPRSSSKPSRKPSKIPTPKSRTPTKNPSVSPTTKSPTVKPSMVPVSRKPSRLPSVYPSSNPYPQPISMTFAPSLIPTTFPVKVTPSGSITLSDTVHHWSFDDGIDWHDDPFMSLSSSTVQTVLDHTGSAHGTFVNMNGSNWISGKQYTGLRFQGNNPAVPQYLSLSGDLSQELGGTSSLSFWIRTSVTGGSSVSVAPGVTGRDGSGGVVWGWMDSSGRMCMSVGGVLLVRSVTAVNNGMWHHIVFTRDSGSGVGHVYVDGGLEGTASGSLGLFSQSFSSIARVTSSDGTTFNYLLGELDQIHIFSRVVSGTEVALLQTNHAPKCWDISSIGVSNRPFSTASVFSRCYDVEGNDLVVSSWSQPVLGTVTYNGDGSFVYTATSVYSGSDTFGVVVYDNFGGFYRVKVKVDVMNENNAGSGFTPSTFTNFVTAKTSTGDVSYSSNPRVPRLVDWDKDGKLDLVVGSGGYIWRHTNVGTVSSPVFGSAVKIQAGGVNIYSGDGWSTFTLVDMTGDGVQDLVLADSSSKLRVYKNTATADASPVYATYYFVKDSETGLDFVLTNRRFDMGDWNGDGKPDLILGAWCEDVKLYLNANSASTPAFKGSAPTVLMSDCYNWYPRLFDISGNDKVDLVRGINWGSVIYWRDPYSNGVGSSTEFKITDVSGTLIDMKSVTDGAIVDFGDLNGDGTLDIIIGGHYGSNIFVAYSFAKSISDNIADIESIYNTNSTRLGPALTADNNRLLGRINTANMNLISYMRSGILKVQEQVNSALTAHISKYPFLKYQTLDTTKYHHVPSIVVQNWVMLHYCLPDTPSRRMTVADVLGLTGYARETYLESGLAIGDNAKSIPGAYRTLRDTMRHVPRELFPDAFVTIDQLYGDQRGGLVWTPNSGKNTFGDWAIGLANEYAGDLTTAIESMMGPGSASGDYFTFVLGHEVTHSLDNYINTRGNKDLRRRWGQMLCYAAGPDVIQGADGWWDWTATKSHFKVKGYWDGTDATWNTAWSTYWSTGYGSTFKNLSFMRFDISWFMDSPQESLATQANHHFANALGRLVGAQSRYLTGKSSGPSPMVANINEVVTFIDFESAGMNRVNLYDTKTVSGMVTWNDHYADLTRNNLGYIENIKVDGLEFQLVVSDKGLVTDMSMTGSYTKYTKAPTKVPTKAPSRAPSKRPV
eukprot:gene6938-14089_t